MSTTYPEYPLTRFPDDVDSFTPMRDPQTEQDIQDIQAFNAYMSSGNVSEANAYLIAHPNLLEMMFNANKLNAIYSQLAAIQEFCLAEKANVAKNFALKNDLVEISSDEIKKFLTQSDE